jgi:hypothetical protein
MAVFLFEATFKLYHYRSVAGLTDFGAELGHASVPFVMPFDARSGSASTESACPNPA